VLFLLLYLSGILYLSLYPWKIVLSPDPGTLVWVPLVARRDFLDAALNLVFYIPLGAAAFLSLRRGVFATVAAIAFGTFVSFAVEWVQLSIPTRFGNLADLASNSAGTLLGVAIAFVATSPVLTPWWRAQYSQGTMLLGLWAGWQAFTFLLPRSWSTMDGSHEIVGLLVLALLYVRRRIRSARHWLLISLALLIWLALDELRPFHPQSLFGSPPQPFSWIPFESWFVGAAESYYGTFIGKLFLYTAILWVERSSGIRWIWALLAPAAILLAGESAQRYLPGRTPELTDVFLLAAGAVMLHLSEPHNKDSA
jgi:VanZ family protein